MVSYKDNDTLLQRVAKNKLNIEELDRTKQDALSLQNTLFTDSEGNAIHYGEEGVILGVKYQGSDNGDIKINSENKINLAPYLHIKGVLGIQDDFEIGEYRSQNSIKVNVSGNNPGIYVYNNGGDTNSALAFYNGNGGTFMGAVVFHINYSYKGADIRFNFDKLEAKTYDVVLNNKVPDAPTEDGEYQLETHVSESKPTYSWGKKNSSGGGLTITDEDNNISYNMGIKLSGGNLHLVLTPKEA